MYDFQNIENLSEEEDKNDASSNNLLVLMSADCNDSILQTTENEVLSTSADSPLLLVVGNNKRKEVGNDDDIVNQHNEDVTKTKIFDVKKSLHKRQARTTINPDYRNYDLEFALRDECLSHLKKLYGSDVGKTLKAVKKSCGGRQICLSCKDCSNFILYYSDSNNSGIWKMGGKTEREHFSILADGRKMTCSGSQTKISMPQLQNNAVINYLAQNGVNSEIMIGAGSILGLEITKDVSKKLRGKQLLKGQQHLEGYNLLEPLLDTLKELNPTMLIKIISSGRVSVLILRIRNIWSGVVEEIRLNCMKCV
jgi:hypothetical protein